jgi:hypothetical protein
LLAEGGGGVTEQDSSGTGMVARLAAILTELVGETSTFVRLCEAGRRMIEADAAALTIAYADRGRVTVAATSQDAATLEDLQTVAGEGPTVDAITTSTVVLTGLDPDNLSRWPLLSQHLDRIPGDGVVMAIPLIASSVPLGVLTVLAAPETAERLLVDAAEFVGAALTAAILHDIEVGGPDVAVERAWLRQAEVHQATGMIVSQIGVRPEDALSLLRAQAFARDVPLQEVAQDFVEQRINFRDFTIEGD